MACMHHASAPPVSALAVSVGWRGMVEMSRSSGMDLGISRGWNKATQREQELEAAAALDDPSAAAAGGRQHQATQLEVCATLNPNPAVRRLVRSVLGGLRARQEPERSKEGMGGSYFFTDENGMPTAILKPCDEEPLAPNNPKVRMQPASLSSGREDGEAGRRRGRGRGCGRGRSRGQTGRKGGREGGRRKRGSGDLWAVKPSSSRAFVGSQLGDPRWKPRNHTHIHTHIHSLSL
jgi:hypothetical protein